MPNAHLLVHYWWVVLVAIAALLIMFAGSRLARRRSRLNRAQYQKRWLTIQNMCHKGETWPLAVIDADTLLDDALKALRYKGSTMGARLVAAQRDLSDNDGVWFAHKLRNKLVHEEIPRLYKREVQKALRGFLQALKDLGAIA